MTIVTGPIGLVRQAKPLRQNKALLADPFERIMDISNIRKFGYRLLAAN